MVEPGTGTLITICQKLNISPSRPSYYYLYYYGRLTSEIQNIFSLSPWTVLTKDIQITYDYTPISRCLVYALIFYIFQKLYPFLTGFTISTRFYTSRCTPQQGHIAGFQYREKCSSVRREILEIDCFG